MNTNWIKVNPLFMFSLKCVLLISLFFLRAQFTKEWKGHKVILKQETLNNHNFIGIENGCALSV